MPKNKTTQTPLLAGKQHIHFIGIGGSGMYPLAQILHARHYTLTGSDNNPTDTTVAIEKMGIPVALTQSTANIQDADLVVYTSAILPDNQELIAAQQSGIPMVDRATLLGELTAEYDNAICISGTHGKTTTTAMLTQIMLQGDYDPTVVLGGKLKSLGGSARTGQSEHLICEACEYQDNFLTLSSDISVILNIDEDHMEYFKTLENLITSFASFAKKTSKLVIYAGDCAYSTAAVQGIKTPTLSFGSNEACDYYPLNIVWHGGAHTSFDLMFQGKHLTKIDLMIPGKQNILNAVAACAAAHNSGVLAGDLQKGMRTFTGASRRFEILSRQNSITIADDYAHHPAEIEVTIAAAKTMGFSRVIAVHQPFTYSRTARLLEDFSTVLSAADIAVVSDIMGSREVNTIGIHATDLTKKIPNSRYFATFKEIADHVASIAKPGDLILTLGCGDVNKCANLLVEQLS